MNNSRYFRELDFARADFFERTGLYRKVLSKGGELLQGAATIRYRRYIRIFSRYKITTRVSEFNRSILMEGHHLIISPPIPQIVYWDDQSIFTEHRFLSTKDNFIHCIVLSRQRIIKTSAEAIMREMLNASPNLVNCTSNNNNISKNNNDSSNLNNNNNEDSSVNQNEEMLSTLSKKNGTVLEDLENGWDYVKPSQPPEVAKWMEYNEISSYKLRNEVL